MRWVLRLGALIVASCVPDNEIFDLRNEVESLRQELNTMRLANRKLQTEESLSSDARIEALEKKINDNNAAFKVIMDEFWLVICGILVFFMQLGFCMLEAGTVRVKNVQSVMLKNVMDICTGTLGWWALGYAFAYGGDTGVWNYKNDEWINPEYEHGCIDNVLYPPVGDGLADNGFIGGQLYYFGTGFISYCGYESPDPAFPERIQGTVRPVIRPGKPSLMAHWFFQWAFCTACATIVSGGVAERMRFSGYLIFSFVMSIIIYPVVVCSTWGGGFLNTIWVGKRLSGTFYPDSGEYFHLGYSDFAGSGVVHLAGGIGAICGAVIVGRRIGRFDKKVCQEAFRPHSVPMVVLGTLILWMGWYGFNCGSSLSINTPDRAYTMSLVAMNTTVSAAACALVVFLVRKYFTQKYDVLCLCNGVLVGLVSITAGASSMTPFLAVVTGVIGGIFYLVSSYIMEHYLRIDDPVDAFSVHGVGGCWGMIAAAVFDFGGKEYHHGQAQWNAMVYSDFDSGEVKYIKMWQAVCGNIAEIVFVVFWVGFLCSVTFGILRWFNLLRVTGQIEKHGIDAAKHFPKLAYGGEDPDFNKEEITFTKMMGV